VVRSLILIDGRDGDFDVMHRQHEPTVSVTESASQEIGQNDILDVERHTSTHSI
jgi:hypothetical protein